MQAWADRIGRRLKLRDLHILMEVVQWRNMTKAAQHLAVSTPVVSKTIADMEQMLGVSLLDRTSKGVEPTIYGRALLNGGVTVFDELRQRVQEIEFLKDPTAGELRIGATTAPQRDCCLLSSSDSFANIPASSFMSRWPIQPFCNTASCAIARSNSRSGESPDRVWKAI